MRKRIHKVHVNAMKCRRVAMQHRNEIHDGVVPTYQSRKLSGVKNIRLGDLQTRKAAQMLRRLKLSGGDGDSNGSPVRPGEPSAQARPQKPRASKHEDLLNARRVHLGINTLSITWITPLSASTSAVMTFASSTVTPPVVPMATSEP